MTILFSPTRVYVSVEDNQASVIELDGLSKWDQA